MTLRCNDCVLEAAQRTARQERSRVADEFLAAGRENDQEFEALIAEEREEHSRNEPTTAVRAWSTR